MSTPKIQKGYVCKCGKFKEFGIYVYAHWDTLLTSACECGRVAKVIRGQVIGYTRKSNKRSKSK